MVTKYNQLASLMALLLFTSGFGCASSYHSYSDCCGVNCRYCEPAPLPYSYYPGCACHSKPGARYLTGPPVRMSQTESSAAEVVSEELDPASKVKQPPSPVRQESPIDVSQRPYDD